MEKRRLGQSDLIVAPVGLGCMGFSHAYGKATEKSEAISAIRAAYEMGYNFFDTAECYTGENIDGSISYNEELVGEALKDVRDKIVIATKFGVQHNADRSLKTDSSPDTIRKSVDGSLKRLGIDVIDLYYQHRIDTQVEPEIVADVMNELIKAGKIRYWGISEVDEEYLRRANKVCQVTAIQNRYSMMARWHEKLFPVLEELNIAFVAFSPMANGLLTGAYNKETKFTEKDDYRNMMPQFTESGMQKSRELLDLLNELAAEKNATPAQISLAWIICKKPYIIPIPGSRKISRLKENFGAGDIQLTSQEIADIDKKLDGMEFEIFGGSPKK
ncbi:MAG: aldo/keto reductase [Selenomonadaceae bacterium]|nr:aldo/keto reductase [Selenomonadaceae bacterium]MBR1859191.1 aldo/keto reductase [Selenomonadaceae bacterium]